MRAGLPQNQICLAWGVMHTWLWILGVHCNANLSENVCLLKDMLWFGGELHLLLSACQEDAALTTNMKFDDKHEVCILCSTLPAAACNPQVASH